MERGFNRLYDFVEDNKPHGRPRPGYLARKSFVERNPEMIKRYWKASIRAYQFMRIKENYPFFRAIEAKLRVNNPDEAERTRDLFPIMLMDDHFFSIGRPGEQRRHLAYPRRTQGRRRVIFVGAPCRR